MAVIICRFLKMKKFIFFSFVIIIINIVFSKQTYCFSVYLGDNTVTKEDTNKTPEMKINPLLKINLTLLEKDTFLVGEPIYVDVEAINLGSDSICYRSEYYELKDSQGKILLNMSPPGFRESSYLGPKEHRNRGSRNVSLYCRFEEGIVFPYEGGAISPGTYIFNIYFGDGKSNTATFTVIAPAGEDKEAFDLLRKAYETYKEDFYNNPKYSKELAEIVKNHPNSAYTPTITYELVYYYNDRTISALEKLIDEYPDYRQIDATIYMLIEGYVNKGKNKDKILQALNNIVQNHKGTRAETVALRKISEIKENKDKQSQETKLNPILGFSASIAFWALFFLSF